MAAGGASISGITAGSTSFGTLTEVAGAANKLVMKTEPSSSVNAGAVLGTQPAVYVEDQYGNVRTVDNTTVVTATVGTGTGPMTSTITATASGGTATFSGLAAPTLAQTGMKLTFTSGVPASAVDGTSIAVNAGSVSAYKLSAGSTTPAAGATDQLTVTQVDQYGNATSLNGDVTTLVFSGLPTTGGTPTVTDKGALPGTRGRR